MKLPWPVEGGRALHPITRTAAQHAATDQELAVDFGSPTEFGDSSISNLDGAVTWAGRAGDAGLLIEITTSIDEHIIVAGWAHNNSMAVVQGDIVTVGQHIGTVGFSGWTIPSGIDGSHLHYKLSIDGVRVDPALYLDNQEDGMTNEEKATIRTIVGGLRTLALAPERRAAATATVGEGEPWQFGDPYDERMAQELGSYAQQLDELAQ